MRSEIEMNDTDLALLANKLCVPLAVRDILGGEDAFEDDARYALHEEISDLQPDSALLSIALAAKEIVALAAYQTTSLKVMNMECDRVIDDYGPLWLKHLRDKKIDDALLFETLANIPEDLEGLAELLQVARDFMRDHDPKAAALCDLLTIQAGAHAMIAEEYVGCIDNEPAEEPQPDAPFYTDNVIPFPFAPQAG